MTEDYISPLTDELKYPTQEIGEGIILYHNPKTNRVIIDVDVSERRGISSTLKTIKIATGSFKIPNHDKMKLQINCYDKEFNAKEVKQLRIKADLLREQKAIQKEVNALD